MPLKCLFFLFTFLSYTAVAESYVCDYNDMCKRAYNNYMSLELEQGRKYVFEAMRDNPYNLMPTFLADYEDCLLLLFNGDKLDLAQRKSHLDSRLALLNKGDKKDPWFRFARAGVYMHWALVYIRFGENLKAATLFRKSYLLLKENQKLFPEFSYNYIYLGLEETIVGVVPDDYKWIAAIFGMKGSVKRGISKLEHFINTHNSSDPLRREAVIYYLYLKFYLLQNQEEVWKYVNNETIFPVQGNIVHQFVYANIAINYRKAEKAISILKLAEKDKKYKKYPILDYEMGSALLNKTDTSSMAYLHSFAQHSRGNLFIKDTWQKLCYAYWLFGNTASAKECKSKIVSHGTLMVDADKQAQRFAEKNVYPDKRLLTARLLIDGGYYNNALKLLNRYSVEDFNDDVSKVEYYFRMGRIYEELGNDETALSFYDKTILAGRNKKEYFAARAMLQMAFIYEKELNIQEALKKYKECLDARGHDFQNSIDQMAKAGLNRLQ